MGTLGKDVRQVPAPNPHRTSPQRVTSPGHTFHPLVKSSPFQHRPPLPPKPRIVAPASVKTGAHVVGAESREATVGRVQALVNLHTCLSHLAAHGVDIAGVDAEDLADGNLKSTLLLVGNIRKKYDPNYGRRSDGDGGVSSDPYRENSGTQGASYRQTTAGQTAMPGRLTAGPIQGGQPRGPPPPISRDKPTPLARRVGGALPGDRGDGQEPRPPASPAAPSYVSNDGGQPGGRYMSATPTPSFPHHAPPPSGHAQPGPQPHPTGQSYPPGQAHPSPAPRPLSARAGAGVGLEAKFHSGPSVEDRLRSLINSADGKVKTLQYEGGELLVPPPPRPRDSEDQQRTSLAGYVPSRPVERRSGPRVETLMERPRSQMAQPMVPPGSHDNQTFTSDPNRVVSHRQQGSTLSMPGVVGTTEGEGMEQINVSPGQDLRSAWNKLFGGKDSERRPSLPSTSNPSQNPGTIPPYNAASHSSQPQPSHPTHPQLQHVESHNSNFSAPHPSQNPAPHPSQHTSPHPYKLPVTAVHFAQASTASVSHRPPAPSPSAVRQVPLPPASHPLHPQTSVHQSITSSPAMRPIPMPSHHPRASSQERFFNANESPQRASPMGQSSSTQGHLSGSTSSSYSGQNITFSTFKPEEDGENNDDNEEEDREVQNVGALGPSSKYPEKTGSRPASARGTPMSLRDTPLSHLQTPLSHRLTPLSHRETPLSHRETLVNVRETPSNVRHSRESLNGDVKSYGNDHNTSWNELHELHGVKFNPMHTRRLSVKETLGSTESPRSGSRPPQANNGVKSRQGGGGGGVFGQGGNPYVNPAFEDSGDEESDRHQVDVQDSIFDYAVSSELSSRSVTPPLPPLSPSQTPEGSDRSSPELGFQQSETGKTPDLLSSSKPPLGTSRRPTLGPEVGRFVKKPPRNRPPQGFSNALGIGRGYNSRLGGRASLSEPRETASESNLSFDVDTTTLLVEASDVDTADSAPRHVQAPPPGEVSDSREGEAAHLRRQLARLESLYHEVLDKIEADRDQSGAAGAGQSQREEQGLVGGAPALHRRWSIASSDTNSLRRSHRSRGSSHRSAGPAREIKNMQRRLQRVESHVVTLARSVAHLTSELRSHSALLHEVDNLKREVRDLRVQAQRGVRMPGLPQSEVSEFERFRGWIPSLTNPRRINKLTKFFGTEPPLLKMFLKKLGYERYSENFENEHIGMIELPYMTEDRLQAIGIPMGPRLRILQEAQLCFRQENFNIYIV